MPDPSETEHDEVVRRHGDLEIEESMPAQRRLWKVQRVGRAAALLMLALALAGLFGQGPLSARRAAGGGHALDYERVAHRDSPQIMQLELAAEAARSGVVRVWIDRDSLRWLRVVQIWPQPARSVLADDRMIFEFAVEADAGAVQARIDFEPSKAGLHTARVGIDGGPTFELSQLVLP